MINVAMEKTFERKIKGTSITQGINDKLDLRGGLAAYIAEAQRCETALQIHLDILQHAHPISIAMWKMLQDTGNM